MARPFEEISSLARNHVAERVTFTGLVFMLALTLTGLAAFASANNLLFLMLAAMLATMLVNSFVSRIGIAGLELDIRLPDHICARRTVAARLMLRNVEALDAFVFHPPGRRGGQRLQHATLLPVIPGGAVLETMVDVRFDRRGLRTEDSFLFSSRFPFGFAERRARVTMKQEVLVYPSIEPQPGFQQVLADVNGDAETLFRGRGHDFYRIRPYQPMESARHVDWRATAHTNALQSARNFAQEQEHLITLFLDLEVPRQHEEWFERAIECCAFLAWECAQRGARVRFRTQDFEVISPVESDVYAILKYLALVECRHRAAPLRNLDEQSVAIVFTASPLRLEDYGWNGSRLLDPGHWAFPTAG